MYAELVYCVFQKINEKYHQYLRLSAYWWRNISIMIINETIILYIEEKAFRQLFIDKKIIQIGEFVKSKPFHYDICFGYSCLIGDKILIQYLISKDVKDWKKGFYSACRSCSVSQNKNAPQFSKSVCDRKQLDIVKLMIAKGFDNWNGGLISACQNGNLEIARLMIEKGANAWNKGLREACRYGQQNTTRLMITQGADNFKEGLSLACLSGNMDLVHLMIENGADNYCGGLFHCGYEDIEEHSYTEEQFKIARLLQEKSMEKGIQNADMWNEILSTGCYHGMLETVLFVMINCPNEYDEEIDWEKAFWQSCRGGNLDIIQSFIEIGVDNWNYGFLGACCEGNIEVAKLMIEHGANNWNSGLRVTCRNGCLNKHIEMVKFLIEKGANNLNEGLLNACSFLNKDIRKLRHTFKKSSNAMYMTRNEQWDLIDLLIAKGANNIEECVSHEETPPYIKFYLQHRYLKN